MSEPTVTYTAIRQHDHTKSTMCHEDCPAAVDKTFLLAALQAPETFVSEEPQKFTYYLHDDYNGVELRDYLEGQGVALSEAAWENMYSPFYEVTLKCEVDTNGNVTILEAK